MGLRTLVSMGVFCLGCLSSVQLMAEEVLLKHGEIELRADLNLADDKQLSDGVILMLHGTLAHNRMEIVETVSGLLNDEGYNTLASNHG